MLVRFVARNPGNHTTIGTFKLDVVPRNGEVVTINDEPRVVRERIKHQDAVIAAYRRWIAECPIAPAQS